MRADDDLIPMAQMPFEEGILRHLLHRWLPPIAHPPTGEQLAHIARDAAQQYLAEEVADEHPGHGGSARGSA